MTSLHYWLSLLPPLLILAIYFYWYRGRERKSAQTRQQAIESGLSDPASLHPIIDRNKCIGCKSCVFACPQQLGHDVLGIFNGKAELLEVSIEPSPEALGLADSHDRERPRQAGQVNQVELLARPRRRAAAVDTWQSCFWI